MQNNNITNEYNEALLNAIYLDAKMALNSIEDVITRAKNTNFQNHISGEHGQYEVITKEALMLAKAQDIKLSDVNCIQKFKIWAGIKVSGLFDCSTRNFANLMFIGTAMGISDIIFNICDQKNADTDIIELAKKLQTLEENNLEELKKFLCYEKEEEKEKKINLKKQKTNKKEKT